MVHQKFVHVKCYFSSFCTKVKKLGTSVLSWTQICNMVHQNSLKICMKCHISSFPKKSYKIGAICVVMNSNLQYGTSKHLESLHEILHFKFSWKKNSGIGDICVVVNLNLQYGTSKVCLWNSTFQVFVLNNLKNW